MDLISYTLKKKGKNPEIEEALAGDGEICGSTFLNRIFDEHLRKNFANFEAWDDGYHKLAMDSFEKSIKRKFHGNKKESFKVPARGLNDNQLLGIKDGQVLISGKDLDDIFELVIPRVLDLVNAQIRNTPKPVKAVVLAGGFGKNAYLFDRIKKAISPITLSRVPKG